ncbi:hypothetical protein P389DRAFT_33108 [Cystobasidium minutum MCA 4210]|uniref:uncharacterized protein n=1 Tax=Cystobasidium minutum MCA 4210 TaxID=1397322 RepID=UPI0034CF3497|eukprot:jgi/Rhomi1/33108/CE33107_164
MAQEDAVLAAAAASGWITYNQGSENDLDFEDWLQKYRPSRAELQNFAWISVRATGRPTALRTEDDVNKESEEISNMQASAANLASELAEKVQSIDNDPNIPLRGNKKKDVKGKKDLREIEHEMVKNRLKNLAIDSRLVSGKWMFFPSTENVDALWTKIAKAIILEDGPLRGKVFIAKVSTYQPGDGEKPAVHVICVYCEDSWNRDLVGDAFKTLVKEVGVVPGSYKADIYTYAGIDSKHPSKMRSTLYGKNDFMTKEELDAHFEAKKAENPAPVVVKKVVKGTGFIESGSSDDEDEPKAKKSKK